MLKWFRNLNKYDCPYCKFKIKLEEGTCPNCNKIITSWDVDVMLTGKISDDQCT